MNPRFLLLVFTICFTTGSIAQNKSLPELRQQLKKLSRTNDSVEIAKTYFFIGIHFQNNQQADSAISNYNNALKFSKESKNYLTLGSIYNNLSTLTRGTIDTSLANAHRGLYYRTLSKDSLEMATSYMQLADLYDETGAFTTALNYSLNTIRIYERKQYIGGLINAYNNIAVLYGNIGESRKMIDYYLLTIKLLLQNPDSARLSGTYNNLGNAYKEIGNNDSAFDCYNKSLHIRESMNDVYGIGESYFNIADLYYGIKQYSKALPYIRKSVVNLEKTNKQIAEIYGYQLLGSILDELGNTEEAESYLLKATKAAEDSKEIPEMNRNFKALANHYEKKR